MAFVLDASMTASWILPDERSEAASLCLEMLRLEGGAVPVIWWYEVRNLVLMAERRKRIDIEYGETALHLLDDYPITIDRTSPDPNVLVRAAREHGLTIYDAAYLELALRLSLPFATLDRKLASAARNAGVRLVADGSA